MLTASSAISCADRVANDLRSPIGPPRCLDCCAYDMLDIWYAMDSSQAWLASTREIILASFWRMAGCWIKGLPKTMRWLHHLRHSSTTVRDMRMTPAHIMKR